MSRQICAAASLSAAAMKSLQEICEIADHDVYAKPGDRIYDDATADKVCDLCIDVMKQVDELYRG